MADLFTQQDLERHIGPTEVAQLLDDDGDGVADAANVAQVIDVASDMAVGLLRGGFSEAQILDLAANDWAVKEAVLDIAAGLCGKRRKEFGGASGEYPYKGRRDEGIQTLKDIAAAKRRAKGEATAGINQRIGTTVNVNRDEAPLVFTPTKKNPVGPGGF